MLGLFFINWMSSGSTNGFRDVKRAMRKLDRQPLSVKVKVVYAIMTVISIVCWLVFIPAGIASTLLIIWLFLSDKRRAAKTF